MCQIRGLADLSDGRLLATSSNMALRSSSDRSSQVAESTTPGDTIEAFGFQLDSKAGRQAFKSHVHGPHQGRAGLLP